MLRACRLAVFYFTMFQFPSIVSFYSACDTEVNLRKRIKCHILLRNEHVNGLEATSFSSLFFFLLFPPPPIPYHESSIKSALLICRFNSCFPGIREDGWAGVEQTSGHGVWDLSYPHPKALALLRELLALRTECPGRLVPCSAQPRSASAGGRGGPGWLESPMAGPPGIGSGSASVPIPAQEMCQWMRMH